MIGSLEEVAEHFRLGFSNLIVSFAVAVLFVITVGAPLGMAKLEAPLLLAIVVNTLAAGLVATLTGQMYGEQYTPNVSRKRAAAAFVFTNSASSLTMLATHFVERVEVGDLLGVRNGLTLLLDLSFDDRALSVYLWTYLICVFVAFGLALVLVLQGARLFSLNPSRASASNEKLLGALSTWLMIVSISIGTTWQPVPFESQQLVGWYGTALVWVAVGLGLLLSIAYSVFSFFAVMNLVSIVVAGIVRRSRKLSVEQLFAVLVLVLAKLISGAVRAAMWLGGSAALLLALVFALEALSSIPSSVLVFFAVSFLSVARSLLLFVAVSGVLVLLGILIAIFAPRFIRWSRKAFLALSHWFIAKANGVRRFFVSNWQAGISTLGGGIIQLRNWLQSSSRLRSALKFFGACGVWIVSSSGRVVLAIFRFSVSHTKELSAFVLVMLAVSASTIGYVTDGAEPSSSEQSETEPDEETVADLDPPEVEVETPIMPDRQPVEFVFAELSPICSLQSASLNWAFGKNDTFEVPISKCQFPEMNIGGPHAVVVLGVSSTGGSLRSEEQRALDRGLELANLVSETVPASTPIFVLNLGMAESIDSTKELESVLGFDGARRPAVAASLKPYPSDANVAQTDYITRIERIARRSRVQSNFSRCELYRVSNIYALETVVSEITEFDCR